MLVNNQARLMLASPIRKGVCSGKTLANLVFETTGASGSEKNYFCLFSIEAPPFEMWQEKHVRNVDGVQRVFCRTYLGDYPTHGSESTRSLVSP